MIPITSMKGKRVAVFGLGGSGLVTAEALVAGGAEVIAWDDNEGARAAAEARELQVTDWRGTEFGAYSALVLAPGVPLTHTSSPARAPVFRTRNETSSASCRASFSADRCRPE